jgi:tetratricopeptide (TPR) repeat protein
MQKKAFDHMAKGNGKNALSIIEDLSKKQPENPSILYEKGFIHYSLKQFDIAENVYRELIGLSPNYMDVHYNLGLALKQQKKFKQALKEFEISFSLNKNRPEEFHINYAETEYYLWKWEDALESLYWMFKYFPDSKKGKFLDKFIRQKIKEKNKKD